MILTKKHTLVGSVIAAVIIGYVMLSSQSADAATITLTTQAGKEFDKYISQAKEYAGKESSPITQGILNASIDYVKSQKSTIVKKAVTSGQSVASLLAPLFVVFPQINKVIK